MKLFLSSQAISYSQGPAFLELTGKTKAKDVRIALIENAADVYQEVEKGWMYDNRTNIQAHGFQVDLVNLEEYRLGRKRLLSRLEGADAIWLGGGNTYYLRWILRETQADVMIRQLVRQGKIFGGGSAGAIVAGPTLKHFEIADDPKKAPEIIYEGLSLANVVVVPHWANEKYRKVMVDVEDALQKDGFDITHITDEQALVIANDIQNIVS